MGQRIETVAMLQGVDRGGLATRVVKPPEVSPRARGGDGLDVLRREFPGVAPARAWGGLVKSPPWWTNFRSARARVGGTQPYDLPIAPSP